MVRFFFGGGGKTCVIVFCQFLNFLLSPRRLVLVSCVGSGEFHRNYSATRAPFLLRTSKSENNFGFGALFFLYHINYEHNYYFLTPKVGGNEAGGRGESYMKRHILCLWSSSSRSTVDHTVYICFQFIFKFISFACHLVRERFPPRLARKKYSRFSQNFFSPAL